MNLAKEIHKDTDSINKDKPMQDNDSLDIKYIDKNNATFKRTPGGFVALEFDGTTYDRISVYKVFPFTDPDSYISIREPDEKAREIGIIKSLKILDKDSVVMLTEQLNLRYFTPVITKINDIKNEYGFAYFDVLTNRGAVRFTTHTGSGSFIRLTETRIIINTIDGSRFEIPDITKLSSGELKKLDMFI